MPPFQYQYYQNPYIGTIGDLLLRQGLVQANLASDMGRIQAAAQMNTGQVWGDTIRNIGQNVGNYFSQAPERELQQQRQQLTQLQLNQAQREAHSQDVLQGILQDPANRDASGNLILPNVLTAARKSNDWGAIQGANDYITKQQQAALQQETGLLTLQQKRDEIQKAAATQRAAQLRNLGNLAAKYEDVAASGDRLGARDQALAEAYGIRYDPTTKEYDPEDVARFQKAVMTASPDQIRQTLQNFIPRDMQQSLEEARGKQALQESETREHAATAEEKEAEAASLRETGRKTPGTLEEQYLWAKTHGNDVGAQQILDTIRATSNAKKDPAMAKLADELAHTNLLSAQERLRKLQEDAQPLDIEEDIHTTMSGRRYFDSSNYTQSERPKARQAAAAAGVPMVTKDQATALADFDTARMNQQKILDQIKDLLPRGGPGGRVIAAPLTKLEQVFQTNDQKAAYASWRTSAIQALRATAGPKGLRINRAEIEQAIENDIPQLTDTYGTAQQKVANIMSMLDSAERVILDRDRSQAPAGPAQGPSIGLTPGLQGVLNR